MQVPISSEEYFASFEQPTKSKKPSSPSRSPKRLPNEKFDKKLNKHLASFSDNIMKTPPRNNNLNPPAITKMRHNNDISPSLTTITQTRYSKGRQNRSESGGLGRGTGGRISKHLGGLYGRGIGRGGGGIGPVFHDQVLTYKYGDTIPQDNVLPTTQIDDNHNDPKTASTPGTHIPSPTAIVTPDNMDIDLESSLQRAVEFSSAAFSSFMAGIVGDEQHNRAIITPETQVGDQWFDAEEGDKKQPGRDQHDIGPQNVTGTENIISQIPIINSLDIGRNLGIPTPGVAIAASAPGITGVVSTTDTDNSGISPAVIPISTNGHLRAPDNNPYRRRNGGRRNNIQGPPIVSQYNITVRPDQVTHEFQIEYIIGALLQAMQDVDSSAAILPHTDKLAPKLINLSQIPKTDQEMDLYIEDPRTSSSGKFGKLSARLTFETTIPFPIIKRNVKFASWIRQEGLYFDKSELPSPRIKYIGFFDKKLPHGTRIPFFTGLLRKLVNISKPFQILSTLVKASEESTVQAYAYLLVAAPADEACILQEMQQFRCSHTTFYGWESFKDPNITSVSARENILIEMRDYVSQHMSLLFTGFNENVLMRATSLQTQVDSTTTVGDKNYYAELHDDDDDEDAMDITTKHHIIHANPDKDDLDVTLKALNMLDFIQTYFVDVNEESVFIQLYGPVNNQIEVHYDAINHIQVQGIEEILLETLHLFMSDAAKAIGLSSSNAQVPSGANMHNNNNRQRQSSNRYKNRNSDNAASPKAKRTKPSFRKTSHSTETYHSASISGRRKVDIPSALSIMQPSLKTAPTNLPIQASYASVSTASMTNTTPTQSSTFPSVNNTDTSTLSSTPTVVSQQVVDHIKTQIRLEFDEQFQHMKTLMSEIQTEATEAKTIATDVAKQLTVKQEEVIGTIDRLKQSIDERFIKQESTSTETNSLLERLVSAANLSTQQQQSFHYQPQSFYPQPQQFNPYYMPPVTHLLPHQQQQANQIAHLDSRSQSDDFGSHHLRDTSHHSNAAIQSINLSHNNNPLPTSPTSHPVSSICFISNTIRETVNADIVFESDASTDSFSMYSTERLWAETIADIALARATQNHTSIQHTSTSLSSHHNSTTSTTYHTIDNHIRSILDRNINYHSHSHSTNPAEHSDFSDSSTPPTIILHNQHVVLHDGTNANNSHSSTSDISRIIASNHVSTTRHSTTSSVTTIDPILQGLQQQHDDSNMSISMTNSTCASTINADSLQSQIHEAPLRTFFFYTLPPTIRSNPPYNSFPEDDEWSQSSLSSDSTHTTCDSTVLSQSECSIYVAQPYHNPRFLGNMDYYFPPRLQPRTEAQAPSLTIPNNPSHIHHPETTPSPCVPSNADSELSYSNTSYRSIPGMPLSSRISTVSDIAEESNITSSAYKAPRTINIGEHVLSINLSGVIPATPIPLHPTISPDTETNPIRSMFQSTLDQSWDNFQSSAANVRANDSWGDSIDVKCDHSFRIYYQNVNSLGLSQGTNKLNTVLHSLQKVDCDIINIVQTSINWRFLHLRTRLRLALRKIFPIHKLNVSRNKFPSDQPALPGGCAQIINGDWSGRVVEYIHDFRNMGRWCGIKMRLKGERFLYIITAYRVCNQHSSSIGPETAYRQQELMLALDGFVNPDPRRQFIIDLMTSIKQWQASGDEILLSMDINEQLGDSAHGLTKLMRECKLIDMFHQHHGVYPAFETFDLGSKRLDYIVGSASLLPFITRCGYLPFYQGVPSDHRGLFIDLSTELIDGITRLESTPTRFLHSSFQKDVYQYKQYVKKAFDSHQIFQKAQELYQLSETTDIMSPEFAATLEKLDHLILHIQLKAEKQCCKHRTRYDWSDEIYYTKRSLLYWHNQRKRITRHRDTTLICQAIYTSLPIAQRQYIDTSTGSTRSNWLKTHRRLKDLMIHHRKTMADSRHALLDNEAKFTGTTTEKIRDKQARIKKDKKLYTTLRHHFHPSQRSGITHLIIPDKDIHDQPTHDVDSAATWRIESNPQQVLEQLFARNLAHFGQAEGTPFTIPPLSDQFTYTGMSSSGTNLIQAGTMPPVLDASQRHANVLLQRLSEDHQDYLPLDNLISITNFTTTIRKWSESTSTSPSGKHLGHYKSLIAIDSHSSTYTDDDPDPGTSILLVLFQIAAAAFQTGLSLPRWQKVNTCMIEKIPGSPRINKLRVIHLYEADYNAFNKMIWQRGTVWEAHKNKTLNPAQSGSRPDHNSIDVVMSKDQKYTYSQLTKTSMATMDNDAKSCYDRIVATLALLVSHKFGVPSEFCQTVGTTLRTMQFSIRTAMGDSSQTYCHGPETPIHGVGQGGTASPAFWLLVSSIMFDCYQRFANGMTLTDPTNTISITQWLEALVDDTSVFTNVPNDSDIHTLVRTLESDAQEWERFLSASGGCLELSKCFYYVLAWSFNNKGDATPMSIEEINSITPPIHLQESDKPTPTPISSKNPSEAHRTLGVWKSMDGNVTEQIKVLTQRSNNLANIVSTSGLYPYQADVALRMIYIPAMCYALPAVSIDAPVLNKIQNKALESFIPAMGYNKGFPRAVALGPLEYGGVGIPHLYTEMNVTKLEYIIMHLRINSDLGKLIRINLNWVQVNLGISTPLFEYKHPITYLRNWFIHLHDFVRSIDATIVIKHTYVPIFEREFDCCIMDSILQWSVPVSKNQLRHLHNWRLFYQVHKLSDMTNQEGDSILPMYLTFPTDTVQSLRQSKMKWPRQEAPTCKTSFKLWVKCIRSCYLQGRSTKLARPLGKWIVSPTKSESTWPYYIDHTYNYLIKYSELEIVVYSLVTRKTSCTTTFDTSICDSLTSIPDNYFPVHITCAQQYVTAFHAKQRMVQVIRPRGSLTPDLVETISRSIQWKKHLLQHFHIYDPDDFIHQLQNIDTTFIIVSDGGLHNGIGSFGVAFGTLHSDLGYIEGPAPGNNMLITSLRSEAYGMLAGISFLNVLIQHYNIIIPTGRIIRFYSDNLGLVKWIGEILTKSFYPRMYLRAEADVLLQIEKEIEIASQQQYSISIEHVKGHQDDTRTYNELSRPAQLNVRADEYATNYLRNGIHHDYDEFCTNPVTLYICDQLITRDYKNQIRCASRSPDLRKYLIEKYDWKFNTPDLIWWQVHHKSIISFSKANQRRIRKYIFGWLPTCEFLNAQDNTSCTPFCPSCFTEIENHKHLIRCTCNNRALHKDRWFKELDSFLSNEQYTPSIIRNILYNHVLYESYSYPDPPTIPDCSDDIRRAVETQRQIGWHQILKGRLSIDWGNIISAHLATNRIPAKEMTTDRWGKQFIKMMYQLFLDIWEYRNADGHQTNTRNESILARRRIMAKILALQESNPEVRYCDRDFIFCSIEALEKYSLGNLVSWHRSALSIIRAQQKYNQRHRSIRDIFPPATHPHTQDGASLFPPPEPDPS